MPPNGTYRTKVPYREGAFKLGRAAGKKIATAVHRGLVSVGCQTVDTDNDEGGGRFQRMQVGMPERGNRWG